MSHDAAPCVYVVDDDPEVQHSVQFLMESVGLRARSFSSAGEFMDAYADEGAGCLILDLRMPGMSGLEAQEKLRDRDIDIPVIIMTGHGDVPAAVRAMKMGAIEFLEKPCNDHVLIEKVHAAIEHDVRNRQVRERFEDIERHLLTLSDREKDVMKLIVDGKSNKEVARLLELSPKTVERHRANIMRKLGVGSFAELVQNITVIGFLDKETEAGQ